MARTERPGSPTCGVFASKERERALALERVDELEGLARERATDVGYFIAGLGWRARVNHPAEYDRHADARIGIAFGRDLRGTAEPRFVLVHAAPAELHVWLDDEGRLPEEWHAEVRRFLQERDVPTSSQPTRPRPIPVTNPPVDFQQLMARPVRRSSLSSRSEGPSRLTGGYVFISYSRDDQDYVDKLVAHLRRKRLECWIDRSGVDYGDRWEKVIQTQLDACSVFVVVMTPSSESRPWVMREIARAEKREKPILPLLLRGEEFFRLSDIQHEDVVGGAMPSPRWVRKLQRLVNGG